MDFCAELRRAWLKGMADVTGPGREQVLRWAHALGRVLAEVTAPRPVASGGSTSPPDPPPMSIGEAVRAAHAAGIPF